MKLETIIYIVVAIPLAILIFKFVKHKSLYPFMPFKYNFNKRRATFRKTLELLNERNVKVLVETGTSRKGLKATRGDGAATIVFGKWASQNKAKLFSVDISEESVSESRNEVKNQGLDDVVTVYLSDSIAFLNDFKEPVDFLYLDSYDYSSVKEVQVKSQEHHLKEFKAIESRLHDKTIVLIDDCRLEGGGKGKMAIEYMLQKDWKILVEAYQVLLVKK
ncbi:MAG: class I SAM-dependent methyltransferase [Flavobacteriaceae bacterium]